MSKVRKERKDREFREKSIRPHLPLCESLRVTAVFRLTHVPVMLSACLSHGSKPSKCASSSPVCRGRMPSARKAALGTGCAVRGCRGLTRKTMNPVPAETRTVGQRAAPAPPHDAGSTHPSPSRWRANAGFSPLEHKKLRAAPPALRQLASQFII